MTTLSFRDSLQQNPFSANNVYSYTDIADTGLFIDSSTKLWPYIMRGANFGSELKYSAYLYQLRGRILNTKRIKEVMDSSKFPLIIRLKDKTYLMGKGFLGVFPYPDITSLEILFLACIDPSLKSPTIDQVKIFISKSVYKEEMKPIQPAVKDFMSAHPGDIILTNNIIDYVFAKIELPKVTRLSEMQKYKDAVVKACLEKYLRWIPS